MKIVDTSLDDLIIKVNPSIIYSTVKTSVEDLGLDEKIDMNELIDLSAIIRYNLLNENNSFLLENLNFVLSKDPNNIDFFSFFNYEDSVLKLMDNISISVYSKFGDCCVFKKGFDGQESIGKYYLKNLADLSYEKSIKTLRKISDDRLLNKFLFQNGFDIKSVINSYVKKKENIEDYLNVISDFSQKIKNRNFDVKSDDTNKILMFLPAYEKTQVIKENKEAVELDFHNYGDSKIDNLKNLTDIEQFIYLNLIDFNKIKNNLKRKIVGQDGAIEKIVDGFILNATGTADNKIPRNILAVGPTGVGKNYIFEVLSQEIKNEINTEFGYKEIPCSKFVFDGSINELVGSPKGYIGFDEEGVLTSFYHENIKRKPFNIILFDEFEKGHSKMIEFFLPILDKGGILDNRDDYLDFSKTYIAFTSNLGYSDIRGNKQVNMGFSSNNKFDELNARKSQIENKILNYFSPEFINRVNIVHFDYLSKDAIDSIFDLEFEKINGRFKSNFDLNLEITYEAKKDLINKGYSMEYGARFLRSTLENKINRPLSNKVFFDQEINLSSAINYLNYVKNQKNLEYEQIQELNMGQIFQDLHKALDRKLPYKKLVVDYKDETIIFRN